MWVDEGEIEAARAGDAADVADAALDALSIPDRRLASPSSGRRRDHDDPW
jgi:hypothetical protein